MMFVQGRELYPGDFVKNMFDIRLRSDIVNPFSSEHGMMIDKIRLHVLPVWFTLTCAQGHMGIRKLGFVQLSCSKVVWSSPNFCSGWLC